MNIKIVAVGKVKEKYIQLGIEEFSKRLRGYAKFEMIEVVDEKAPETLSLLEGKQVRDREGERILSKIAADEYVIALAIEGQSYSSEHFAKKLDKLTIYGKSKITFVIGGSLGLSETVYTRANMLLSFSPMTFPHQLMLLILMEQIYRSFRIIRKEPYHK